MSSPIVAVSNSTKTIESPSNDQDESELRELLEGMEALSYPEKFYECRSTDVQQGSGVLQEKYSESSTILEEAPHTQPEKAPEIRTGSVKESSTSFNNFPQTSSAPLLVENVNSYTFPPTSANAEYKISQERNTRKFYRIPLRTTKTTSRRQLYQTYASVMQSVQFDSFQESTSDSRYEFDTCSVVLKSATNSSKGSTPSRGSSRAEIDKSKKDTEGVDKHSQK
ncbi:hypothetical protein CLIB1423_11S01134 [[Candida] railenensis]|uniref:Uncharacterized protein n=1 Tax=[Candida] railenensis TaxID=45579 RepID=A0A9P0VYA3_9ASCO|nr:hypothetical protein CLIB1423_11S01134 [[Candida] railenensis]